MCPDEALGRVGIPPVPLLYTTNPDPERHHFKKFRSSAGGGSVGTTPFSVRDILGCSGRGPQTEETSWHQGNPTDPVVDERRRGDRVRDGMGQTRGPAYLYEGMVIYLYYGMMIYL